MRQGDKRDDAAAARGSPVSRHAAVTACAAREGCSKTNGTVIAMTQAPGLHNFYVFPIVARLRDMKKRVCDAEADWCDKNPYWTMPKYLLGNLF